MKVGDLVKINKNKKWLSRHDFSKTGVVLEKLSLGSHRKQSSYLVLWSDGIDDWCVECSLVPANSL